MHDQYIINRDRKRVNEESTFLWLSRRGMKAATATKDQALQAQYHATKYYKLKQTANADCQKFDETVERITSACPRLAKEKYIKRHDKV